MTANRQGAFEGRTVLVTGASMGIGRAVAVDQNPAVRQHAVHVHQQQADLGGE